MSRSKNLPEHRRVRPLLGTLVEVVVPAGPRSAEMMERAFSVITRVQTLMSAHDVSSDLGRLHAASPGQPVALHPWTWRVLAAAERMRQRTRGIFDVIAAGAAAEERGDLPPWSKPAPPAGRPPARLKLLSRHRASLSGPARIDLGGIAKGFAVDQAVRALKRAGLPWGLVNAGGDLRGFGPRTWTIHLRHPAAPGQLLPREICNCAVATSAPYFSKTMQDGRLTSALFDARSLRFITEPISATVFAPTCLVADALTKTILAGGESTVLNDYRARALLLVTSEKEHDAA